MNINNRNILVLAAHPDDETLGCGATIARLSHAGNTVKLLTFTDGHGSRDGESQLNRNNKLDQVCEILGIKSYTAGTFPDNQMDSVALLDICKFIESNISEDPEFIFTHCPGCLNIDHTTVFRAAQTVFRPQNGNEVGFYSFSVPSSTEWNSVGDFNGNTYFDAKDFVQLKMDALKCYESEMREYPHPRSFENVRNIMSVVGSEVGLEYAEKFQTIRQVIC